MIVAIWGRDGTGKSTLADALAQRLTNGSRSLVALIDTDLTQPTLPVRLPLVSHPPEASLGRVLSGVGTQEPALYLRQHPKVGTLFVAGLAAGDDLLAYELGLSAHEAAGRFVASLSHVDHIVLDVSGQRTDPFLMVALQMADTLLLPFAADPQGVCWWEAVQPLLERTNATAKVLPVLSRVRPYQDVDATLKASGLWPSKATIPVLPYSREIDALHTGGETTIQSTGNGRAWNRLVNELHRKLTTNGGETS